MSKGRLAPQQKRAPIVRSGIRISLRIGPDLIGKIDGDVKLRRSSRSAVVRELVAGHYDKVGSHARTA